MSAPRVVAVIAGTRPPVPAPASLADVLVGPGALARGVAGDSDWLWLLADGARVRGDALPRLLGAVTPAGEPAAALVAGIVLDGGGHPVDALLPAADQSDTSLVLRLAAARLCPVRHASFAHTLVRRADFERFGLPDERAYGRYAPEQWTARLLREEPGRLCAESVVTLPAMATPNPRGLGATFAGVAATVRMARSGVWTRGETLHAVSALAAEAGLSRPRRAAGP